MDNNQDKKQTGLNYSEVENGPLVEAKRQSRDAIGCMLFFINLVWMLSAAGVAYTSGNPQKIFRPYFFWGWGWGNGNNMCGYPDGNWYYSISEYPYAYFYRPSTMEAICVKECPSSMAQGTYLNTPYYGSIYLNVQVYPDGTSSQPISLWDGNTISYDSTLAFDRICMPTQTALQGALSPFKANFANLKVSMPGGFFLDVKNNWIWLSVAFLLSIIFSFLFVFCLRCLPSCTVYASIIGIILSFGISGLLFLYIAGTVMIGGTYNGYLGIPDPIVGSVWFYNIIAGVSIFISLVSLFVTLCCCSSRIRLAKLLCKAAANYVSAVGSVYLVPFFHLVLTILLWVGCLAVAIYLFSTTSFGNSNYYYYYYYYFPNRFPTIDYGSPEMIKVYFFIVSTVWCNSLIQALAKFVIASSSAMWYYAQGAGENFSYFIRRSYKIAFRYHLGSLAIGSLALTLLQFLEMIVDVFKRQPSTVDDNQTCSQYLSECCQSCLGWVEYLSEFINRSAYIQMAIGGKGFIDSSKDAFKMGKQHNDRYFVFSGLGSFLTSIGSLSVAAVTTMCFLFITLFNLKARRDILQPIYLVILVFFLAHTLATIFNTIYGTSMDTLVTCYIIDEANSKEKGKKPQHAPQELAEAIEIILNCTVTPIFEQLSPPKKKDGKMQQSSMVIIDFEN